MFQNFVIFNFMADCTKMIQQFLMLFQIRFAEAQFVYVQGRLTSTLQDNFIFKLS